MAKTPEVEVVMRVLADHWRDPISGDCGSGACPFAYSGAGSHREHLAREVVAALDTTRDAEINDRWRALVGGIAIGARANGNFDRERAALDILAIDERTP